MAEKEYIEREAAINVVVNNPYRIAFKTGKTIQEIKEIPTADVVPKSEVEKLQKDVEGYKHLDKIVTTALNILTDDIRQKVAREIFEEIEEIFNKRIAFYTDMAKQSKFTEKHYAETMIKNCEIYLQEIAELKKKYTEGQNNQ